jgi:hypothetical protein
LAEACPREQLLQFLETSVDIAHDESSRHDAGVTGSGRRLTGRTEAVGG